MSHSITGGQQPPVETEKTVDDLLNSDVRHACNQIEAVELGAIADPNEERWRGRFDNFVMGLFFLALSFLLAIWWDNKTTPVAEPFNGPEVRIGVDPNNIDNIQE